MLILILIDIQYSQKAVSSFEKGSKRQNDLSSGFLHAVKKIASPSKNIRFSPLHWGEFTFLSTTYHDLEFHKYSISCFLEKVVLINWLPG